MLTISNKEYSCLAEFIRSNYGINLKEEKKPLIISRLHYVLSEKGFNNFSEYYDYVVSDKTGEAVITLMDKITTNHTFFMREPDHFYYFKDNALPYFAESLSNKDLRVWSAGCSSGQEPYTLAMIIDEFFGTNKMFWDTKILATDISNKVLSSAVNGIYSSDEIVNLPAHWKINYFKNNDKNNVEITANIKKEIIFRKFNLMEKSFPFKKKFHIIFCRNVMIYFDLKTKQELVNKFYDSLEYGGYLFIGHSESINRDESKFKYVKPSVYRKI